ncbi:DUF4917 family protein [Christiangramia sediminis]|uniref:DUF4917 family protein n=1 Tax=Christiangramia sediminis TaxID=2881336 RepID=A0A9X1RXL0_9FLAO|nr:DUF4917 family protein [Christiangramia sediminis]MCB7481611.1 DUF4917 family protein [Christiangramia sediminis]
MLTFQEAIKKSESYSTRHLVLGNGFSIACVPSIFTYTSLYEQADFSEYPEIEKSFEILKTTDFELIVNAMENSSAVLPAYLENHKNICKKMNFHSLRIKELLIETVANNHPPFPSEIPEEKYESCRKFLSHFISKGKKGRIYSLNYDLLLYWTLMHEIENETFSLIHNDGFGRDSWLDDGEPQFSDELIWQGKTDGQNIHYIHGALHLYDQGSQLEKFSWVDTGLRLIDQSKKALEENKFPLFVTEGDSTKKIEKIAHNPYLYNSYKSFDGVTQSGKGKKPGNTCIFTYGISFSDNDKHIFEKISNGRIKALFVSIYGEPESEINKKIIQMAAGLSAKRSEHPLKVFFYNAESAQVWNS